MEEIGRLVVQVGVLPVVVFFLLIRQEKVTKENTEATRELRDEIRKQNGFAETHMDRHHRD